MSLAPLGRASSGEPIAIVVSADWQDVRSVSLAVLRRLYLGKLTRLGDVRVVCMDFPSGTAEREGFSRSVLGKSELEMHDYWIEQALTGGQLPPLEVSSAGEVMKSVANNVGMIGYLRWSSLSSPLPSEVRVLKIEGDAGAALPDEAGYPIRTDAPLSHEP